MDTGGSKRMKPRELPPLPQRGQRSLPSMPSQDTVGEVPATKHKKKRVRKETNGVDDMSDHGMEMGGYGSRRESEIGEQLSSEATTDAPPQRRRKKKKAATIDLDDDQADLVNGDAADQTTDGEEVVKKPKKKKKSKVVESQLPDELDVEEDDIVTGTPPPIPQQSLFTAPQGHSRPVGKVFVEKSRRFQPTERSNWRKTSDQTDIMSDFDITNTMTTKDVSMSVHIGFRRLGMYFQGFLAGYAMWNVVLVYGLAGQHLTALSNLLEQYNSLAYPSQSLLNMLLTISTVAAFDRVNLAEGTDALHDFKRLNPLAVASFLYFSALVLNLSQQMTSDRINLYPTFNTTLWPPGMEHQILHPWATVNLVVALLVGVAWFLISTQSEKDDHTEKYLNEMVIEPLKPEDKSEMTA
ncbi:transmembrane protein 237B [Centropristis striata]|uniref:transmembrane protein 237B n=1 Tax=Centropristis striata TaxID=184440 RepID=UPI0027DFB1CF|nr:transmembrane protein 237B [Centropristis striata]